MTRLTSPRRLAAAAVGTAALAALLAPVAVATPSAPGVASQVCKIKIKPQPPTETYQLSEGHDAINVIVTSNCAEYSVKVRVRETPARGATYYTFTQDTAVVVLHPKPSLLVLDVAPKDTGDFVVTPAQIDVRETSRVTGQGKHSGDTTTMTAALTTDDGSGMAPAAGVELDLQKSVDGVWQDFKTGTTGSDGTVALTFPAPKGVGYRWLLPDTAQTQAPYHRIWGSTSRTLVK